MSISTHADGAFVLVNEAHVDGPTICSEIYYFHQQVYQARDEMIEEFDNPDIVIYVLTREEEN